MTKAKSAGGVVQVLELLPNKLKDPNANSSTMGKKKQSKGKLSNS
jgi:hypothetical protein